MKTKQKITSLLLLSILVVSGCGKHAKPEAEGGAKKDEKASIDGGGDEKDETPVVEANAMLGGSSDLYSGIVAKSASTDSADVFPLLNKEKFPKDGEFDAENVLCVVATLKDDGFHLEPLLQNKKLLTTSFAQYAKHESKLEMLPLVDADKKAVPTKLTVGDKTVDLVAPEKSSVLEPNDSPAVITGNSVKLESGTQTFEGKLPYMMIKADNDKLKKWELDPAKAGYADPMPIEQILHATGEGVKNECILINSFDETKSKSLGGLKSIVITNFVDEAKKQISFEKLEKDKLEKLPRGVEIPVNMICSSIVSGEDKTLNAILITQISDMSITVKAEAAKETAKK